MDTKLHFEQHVAEAATKGLETVLELRRLKGLSPSTARQLFVATVAPTMSAMKPVLGYVTCCNHQNVLHAYRIQYSKRRNGLRQISHITSFVVVVWGHV
ncbi:hypothetical protein LZ30DRAFT_743918 [Colletotrichum cereale]|nr:hypothetical protein LZ30DRAFT_743918 [Colletotrichum cereale]